MLLILSWCVLSAHPSLDSVKPVQQKLGLIKRTLTLKKIKEVRVIFPKKKITFLAQFFIENLIFSSKKQKGLLIFFFKNGLFSLIIDFSTKYEIKHKI